MDQSQQPAEPVRSVSPGTLVRQLKSAERVEDTSEAAQENRQMAALELESIYALHSSGAFAWYEAEFVDKPFRSFSEKLRGVISLDPQETIATVQISYMALRQVKVGIIEREIAHRELLDANDEMVPTLREKLALL